jgi:OsmC-like protein
LLAALATCFCNDLYRETAKRAIDVQEVKVEVTGTFAGPGEPARDISYSVQVRADAPQTQIDDLIYTTNAVTEIQNRVRGGCAGKLKYGRLIKFPAVEGKPTEAVPMNKVRCLLLIFSLFFASLATGQSEPHASQYFFVLLERPSNAPQQR